MIYSEHSQMMNVLDKIRNTIIEYYPDLVMEDDSIQYEWILDIEKTKKEWISWPTEQMIKDRVWEISDAKMCLVRLYKSFAKEFPDLFKDQDSIIFELSRMAKNSLRINENPNLLTYEEVKDKVIENNAIVGGRLPLHLMLYAPDGDKIYPV